MKTKNARRLARWLALPAALFALGCALLAPAEAGGGPSSRAASRTRQQERGKQPPESNSTVRGRVVYDDTHRPIRRARVVLLSEEGAQTEYAALTDGRGEFRIQKVQAGRYFVSVDVPGVLSPFAFLNLGDPRAASFDGMPDLGPGRSYFDPIEVDGKGEAEVTVRAHRGASLAGRVTYADGDPAVSVKVSLMRRDADGRLQMFITGPNVSSLAGHKTDDRGMFRLTGLPPGEYVVGVWESVDHSPDGGRTHAGDMPGLMEAMAGQQLLMSFHPSATSVKEAAVVKVAAGEERADVDIRIPERELHAVSGVVRSRRGGRPLAGARVTIARRDETPDSAHLLTVYETLEAALNSTTTDEAGRWQFKEIPDGQYTVSVKPPEEYEAAAAPDLNTGVPDEGRELPTRNTNAAAYRPPQRKRGFAPARRDVEVSGGALSDVVIEAPLGGRVAGVVTTEAGEPTQEAHVSLLHAPERGTEALADGVGGVTTSGGRFSLDGLPAGRFFLHAYIFDEGQTSYIKSVTWDGKDLMREPLELGEGAEVEGVRVVFARDAATLHLTAVTAGDGKPAPRTNILLLPADLSAWQPYSMRNIFCTTGADGSCPLLAPPGEYRVVTLPRRLPSGGAEGEVRRRAALSPAVSLRPRETKELKVTVSDK